MAENADTASLSPAREARRAPSKRRRASSLPSDSEHELAREAQQPAQPDEPPRDENTLDLFAGDPTHAPVQTVETGRRRSRPSGAERSRPVRSADEADEVDAAEQTAEILPVAAVAPPLAESKPADGEVDGKAGDERAAEVVAPATDMVQSVVAVETNAATVANVLEVAPAQVETQAAEPMLPGQALAQVRTARATAAQRPTVGWAAAHTAAADAVSATATVATTAAAAVPAAADTSRTAQPEPDQARAAASPNTVDALDGLIASQRRASADLSRRMRWMLGAAVGALALTVAAAIAQTIMLSRVAANARAQELRLTQMMAEQQAAFAAALARLPAQSAAPAATSAAQAVPQSVARPAAPVPAHRTRRAAAHGHRAHPVSR